MFSSRPGWSTWSKAATGLAAIPASWGPSTHTFWTGVGDGDVGPSKAYWDQAEHSTASVGGQGWIWTSRAPPFGSASIPKRSPALPCAASTLVAYQCLPSSRVQNEPEAVRPVVT
jgi:hypothetical protein